MNNKVHQGENDWLREELDETEKQLQQAIERLAGLEEEKQQWLFKEEVNHIFNNSFHEE